jgi:DNA invertase Pin-like site-specific DNA recombinase
MVQIGYARVSTLDQELALQRDALRAAGCDRIVEERASGAKTDRSGVAQAIAFVREGDVLVTWKLDRLARSLPHLIETAIQLEKSGAGLRFLTEVIDTTTPGGRLILRVFGTLAQFQRARMRERARAVLSAAGARCRHGGQ